jgi:hypothetical protein
MKFLMMLVMMTSLAQASDTFCESGKMVVTMYAAHPQISLKGFKGIKAGTTFECTMQSNGNNGYAAGATHLCSSLTDDLRIFMAVREDNFQAQMQLIDEQGKIFFTGSCHR